MKILIADDESIYRELLAGIIAQWPEHQVTVAENGLEAWQLLDDPRHFFDLVFLDIKMPGLSGLEVLKRVRATPMLQHTVVVMCTSISDRQTILKAVHFGTKHYIVKPYNEAIIAGKLRLVSLMISQFPDHCLLKPRGQ